MHLHKWGNWVTHRDDYSAALDKQEKKCKKCGKIRRRYVRW